MNCLVFIKVSTTASSLSLVRFDSNDYSVPVRWAHHPIVVKGYWQEVVLCAQGQEVARHRRNWAAEQVTFEPLHCIHSANPLVGGRGR